jgi:hypothetical protein
MDNLDKFVDELVSQKGFAEKDPEVLEQIKLDLLDRVEDRINAMIMENLPTDKLEEFDSKLDNGSDEDIQNFVKKHIPDFKERAAFELVSFKNMYLS